MQNASIMQRDPARFKIRFVFASKCVAHSIIILLTEKRPPVHAIPAQGTFCSKALFNCALSMELFAEIGEGFQ